MKTATERHNTPSQSSGREAQTPALHINALSVHYGTQRAITDASLTVRHGEILGLIGPNGAGKSTLIKTVCGRITPTGGTITIDGTPAHSPVARSQIGLAPQKPAFYERLTVEENLRAFARISGVAKTAIDTVVEESLARTEMAKSASVEVRRLSGGMRQRVNIAIALLNNPSLIILDEPAASLDPSAITDLNALLRDIKQQGAANDTPPGVLLITHDMIQAEQLCDRVTILIDGKICANSEPANLIKIHAPDGLTLHIELTTDTDETTLAATLEAAGLKPRGVRQWSGAIQSHQAASHLIAILAERDNSSPLASVEIHKAGLDAVMAVLMKERPS